MSGDDGDFGASPPLPPPRSLPLFFFCFFAHPECSPMLPLRNYVSSPLLWTNSESPPVANTQNMLRNMIWHTRIIGLSPWASDQARLTRRSPPAAVAAAWRTCERRGFSLSSPLSDKGEEEEPNMGMAEGRGVWYLERRSPSVPACVCAGAGGAGGCQREPPPGLSSASRSALFPAARPQPARVLNSLPADSVIYTSCICRRS